MRVKLWKFLVSRSLGKLGRGFENIKEVVG
jgi:hypothetical protein